MRLPVALWLMIAVVPASLGAQAAAKPAASASPDLKSTLYNAANALGMLRTIQEVDSIATVDYWATGTITVNKQPCKLSDYRASVNFHMAGMRANFTCTTPDGKSVHEIHVVSGSAAWNEAKPGIDATPTPPGTAIDRVLQVWMLPVGIVKAATIGKDATKVAVENGQVVLTCPVPGVAGATMKARLNKQFLTEHVEVRAGSTVRQRGYSDYAELNDADNRTDVFFPRRIVEQDGQTTVADLTVTRTNTLNPYIIMPVPNGVK